MYGRNGEIWRGRVLRAIRTPRNSYFANHQNALKGKIPIKKGSKIGEKFELS